MRRRGITSLHDTAQHSIVHRCCATKAQSSRAGQSRAESAIRPLSSHTRSFHPIRTFASYRIVSTVTRGRWTIASSATRSSNRLIRSHLLAALRLLLNPTTSCRPTRAFTNEHSGRQRAGPDLGPARPAASYRSAAADILSLPATAVAAGPGVSTALCLGAGISAIGSDIR